MGIFEIINQIIQNARITEGEIKKLQCENAQLKHDYERVIDENCELKDILDNIPVRQEIEAMSS